MKTPIDNFSEKLRSLGLRLTKERIDLLRVVFQMKSHFSPEDLLKVLRSKKTHVSRATVYRMLPLLEKIGLIQQSLLTNSQTNYEVTWDKDHHDHLICSQCDKVIEFQDNTIEILQREIANKYGFRLEHHVMELVGRCKNCRNA